MWALLLSGADPALALPAELARRPRTNVRPATNATPGDYRSSPPAKVRPSDLVTHGANRRDYRGGESKPRNSVSSATNATPGSKRESQSRVTLSRARFTPRHARRLTPWSAPPSCIKSICSRRSSGKCGLGTPGDKRARIKPEPGDARIRQGDNRSIAGRGAVHHVKSGKKINGEREFALAA